MTNSVGLADVVPVEYAVAVDRYLAEAGLGAASQRVYRISLTGWAWPLVGKLPPDGRSRRRASPPIVPLALLDHTDTHRRLAGALAHRVQLAGARTVNRELSTLRSAVGWWRRQQWITTDATTVLGQFDAVRAAPVQRLAPAQFDALFRAPAGLREHAFWHLLADSDVAAESALALDADMIDSSGNQTKPSAHRGPIRWSDHTSELLCWLLAGRRAGPVFLTDRRAPAGAHKGDVCTLTGRGRMSYRRAAEIFTEHTRTLDPSGRGWMLHQLRRRD